MEVLGLSPSIKLGVGVECILQLRLFQLTLAISQGSVAMWDRRQACELGPTAWTALGLGHLGGTPIVPSASPHWEC